MRLILREPVKNLGQGGDVVTVKDGYGRNFLIPQGLAVVATEGNVKQIAHHKRIIAAQNAKLLKEAQDVATRLNKLEVVLTKQAGAADKLFGSVTSRDIQDALQKQGIVLERKAIVLSEPIRVLGEHTVQAQLFHGVTAQVKVRVVNTTA